MCPFCIGAVAWAASSALTTAGLGALFAKTLDRDSAPVVADHPSGEA